MEWGRHECAFLTSSQVMQFVLLVRGPTLRTATVGAEQLLEQRGRSSSTMTPTCVEGAGGEDPGVGESS